MFYVEDATVTNGFSEQWQRHCWAYRDESPPRVLVLIPDERVAKAPFEVPNMVNSQGKEQFQAALQYMAAELQVAPCTEAEARILGVGLRHPEAQLHLPPGWRDAQPFIWLRYFVQDGLLRVQLLRQVAPMEGIGAEDITLVGPASPA